MEDAICMCFYTILCCSLCCPPQQPLKSQPPLEVIVDNPGSITGSEKPLKSEPNLNKDGLAL